MQFECYASNFHKSICQKITDQAKKQRRARNLCKYICMCLCKVTVRPRQTVTFIVAVVDAFLHLFSFRFICVWLCCYERFWRCYFWLNWFFICQLDDSHQQLAASSPLNCCCCFADAKVGAHVWGWMENRWSVCIWRKKPRPRQPTRTSGILLNFNERKLQRVFKRSQ